MCATPTTAVRVATAARVSPEVSMTASLASSFVGTRVVLPTAAGKRKSYRGSLLVSNCGNCSRRDLFAGLVTSATSTSRLGSPRDDVSGKARQLYDAQFAKTMDVGMADYEQAMVMVKQGLFSGLAGKDILEIGINTGVNLRYMVGARSVAGVEPNVESFKYAQQSAERYDVPLVLKKGVGEDLPVADASVDVVVSTLVMCTVTDVAAVAREAKRVLRPGGRYLFLDHVAAPSGTPLWFLQNLFDPLNRLAYEGCCLTRDPELAIASAFGQESVKTNRFVAGSVKNSWLVGKQDPSRRKATDIIEPHFLLAPTLVGVATA